MLPKVTIVNGNPNHTADSFNVILEKLYCEFLKKGIKAKYFQLNEEKINQCVGCWDCWWKTPGLCRFDDSVPKILREVINSDLVIYASPMIMGFYSALLKKFHDRTIPLVHPYIEFVQGECHHKKRYPNYPKIGVILDSESTDDESIMITKEIFERYALNFKTEVQFFETIEELNIEKLSDEISNI